MNFLNEKDILELINAQDKEIDRYVAVLQIEIERELNKVISSLKPEATIEELRRDLAKLSIQKLPGKLKRKIDSVVELYQGRIDSISEMFEQYGYTKIYKQNDTKLINAIIEADQVVQLTTVEQTFNQFKQILVRSSLSKKLPDLSELSAKLGDQLGSKMANDVRTQLAGFQRAVSKKKAEDLGLEYFRYSGSLIKTSRQFCIERAGKVFHVSELSSWDNGQGLPVDPYLGGYNCRHFISYMTKEKAEELGISNGV